MGGGGGGGGGGAKDYVRARTSRSAKPEVPCCRGPWPAFKKGPASSWVFYGFLTPQFLLCLVATSPGPVFATNTP